MSYRDTITRLSGDTETRAVDLYQRWQNGEITEEEFDALLAVLVARANQRATTVADLSLAAAVTVALRRPVSVLGLTPPAGDANRLRKAAVTLRAVLDGTPDPVARVARLGRAEPLTTGARAFSTGMAQRPQVNGWVRGLSANACQLCRWWWREGRIWPADHAMPTHKGCTCVPQPVVADSIRPVQR